MKPMLPPLFGAALSLLLVTVANPAAADEPEPTRRYADDRNPPSGTRLNLALAGTAVTALFYAPVLATSFIFDEAPGAAESRIPVVGPWLQIGQTKLCRDRLIDELDDNCSDFAIVAGAVLLALDGLGQAGGVGLIIQSIFTSTEPTVSVGANGFRSPTVTSSVERSPYLWQLPGLEMSPVPLVGDGSDLGLALTGRF